MWGGGFVVWVVSTTLVVRSRLLWWGIWGGHVAIGGHLHVPFKEVVFGSWCSSERRHLGW